jgi:mono/diheme cytochrome c family protein
MSPFGTSNGGPLKDDDIETIVGFIRSWEAKPPVELPPEVAVPALNEKPVQLYAFVCAQCHGVAGEGDVGPEFQSVDFQNQRTDQEIFDAINIGHGSTAMIGWGDILSADQIAQLVALIRSFKNTTLSSGSPDNASFSKDVLPIFEARCASCHGSLGGWDGSNYAAVMESGNNSPVIIAGDPQASLLVQKLFGIQTTGGSMPPGKPLAQEEIDLIVSWIAAGATDN